MTRVADALFFCGSRASCRLHKTTSQTIDYATLFVLLFVKGLNATFKYFERKLTNDGNGREFECKDIIKFALNV